MAWHDRPPFHAGFESLETVPAVFVFMGNFQSYPATSASTDYDAVKQNFSALAAVLQRHRRLVVSVTPHPAHTLPESRRGRAPNRSCCIVGMVIRNDPRQGWARLHGHDSGYRVHQGTPGVRHDHEVM